VKLVFRRLSNGEEKDEQECFESTDKDTKEQRQKKKKRACYRVVDFLKENDKQERKLEGKKRGDRAGGGVAPVTERGGDKGGGGLDGTEATGEARAPSEERPAGREEESGGGVADKNSDRSRSSERNEGAATGTSEGVGVSEGNLSERGEESVFVPSHEHRKKDRRNAKKTEINRNRGPGHTRQDQNAPPPNKPVMFEYPVVIEERGKGGQIWKFGHRRRGEMINKEAGRPIKMYKRLPSGKIVVACVDSAQQTKLSHCTFIGAVPVACKIPAPRVEGVVKGVSLDDQEWEWFQNEMEKKPRISQAVRLKNRKGEPTTAVKLTFLADVLPTEINVGGHLMEVYPYRALARRCTNCQKLGHVKRFCRNKVHVCAKCGTPGHGSDSCKAVPRCVNCHGPHPSSDRECPEAIIWQKATEGRATTYMPFTSALQLAREEGKSRGNSSSETLCTQPTRQQQKAWRGQDELDWSCPSSAPPTLPGRRGERGGDSYASDFPPPSTRNTTVKTLTPVP
jgi:hypothetical protein